ncbi:MAG: RIP metalloprotease RseP [gamma proteobacterium symbiont of Phacoides pectinatus]
MDGFLFTLASFIVALGILIAVHEFGHFWVAKKSGVRVLRFSIGFGRSLWRWVGRDGTEYVVAAIPLGGYVKMLDEREGEVPEAELEQAFNRKPLGVRFAVVAAGPLFNFLFAILAFWVVLVVGDSGTRPLIGEVTAGSVAEQAGFRAGDRIVAVAGSETPTMEAVYFALMLEAGADSQMPVRVRSEHGTAQTLLLSGRKLVELGEGGALFRGLGLKLKRPVLPPVLGEIVPGEAADLAGLRSGDRILSVDGVAMADWEALVLSIRERPHRRVALEVERAGEVRQMHLVIGELRNGQERVGRIGAGVYAPPGYADDYRVEVRYGPLDALWRSTVKTADMSLFTLKMLWRMVSGSASVDNLSGPISIAQTAGKSASYGAIYFLKFLALVSISLGVLNLLPIPVLDGGHLLFYLIEALKGGPVSEAAQIQGQKVGIAILLALMGLAFYVDIARLLG